MASYPIAEGFTYGDVLIKPAYSEISTRDDIDIFSRYLGAARKPIISAPMDYVTGFSMAREMWVNNAYGIISRFGTSIESEGLDYQAGLSIGVKDWETDRRKLEMVSPHSVCIDVAHGDHLKVINTIKRVKEEFPGMLVIAGNVATYDGAFNLVEAGADAIRVGVGPGSACSTRENTGVGVPQLTALIYALQIKEYFPDVSIIADGGIQSPGDIAKALAIGADAVMLGYMLAGHDESPGSIIELNGGYVKAYRGQSLLGSNGARNAPEGVEGFVPYRGPVSETIDKLMHYLRSSMSYVGASNLKEFRERSEFIRVSAATHQESRTRI